jgi:hypothetical protein
MRKFLMTVAAGSTALLCGQTIAADIPEYPEPPEVDYEIGGSFYLRGSAALNWHWAERVTHPADPSEDGELIEYGYGYSVGAGFGYETGSGLRFDATIDQVETAGMTLLKDDGDLDDGEYSLMLRSTVALANAYYDFGFGDGFGYSSNGLFGYVGAGVGVAWNHAEVNSPLTAPIPVPTGTNVSPAAALMIGGGYDMGQWVADLGYRALYIHQINNAPTDETTTSYYEVDNNWIHELRGTVRYRMN